MKTPSSFEQFKISPKILHGIADMGFEEPTPIQVQAIPAILAACGR